MVDRVREIALKVLFEVNEKDAYCNIALDEALKNARNYSEYGKIDARDVGFISEIVYGTISWRLTIDEVIKKYSNLKLKKISPWILNILRMSVYQILFLDKVPKSAAVNEGVNLAKRYGHKASSSFTNAILRKVDKKDYREFFEIKDDIERLSKTTSMPVWIIEELMKQNTYQEVEQVCQASNLKPPLYARVNILKNSKQELLKEFEGEKLKVKESVNTKDFLILEEAKNIEGLKTYKEGRFSIQDEAAGWIPILLNPQPHQKILDACSSPGGKTTYIAELMKNQGEIVAWDLHEHRVKLVEKAADRLGITIVQTEAKDATIYEEKYLETFDKILLDVPCLGMGVLKRKPDIKWKRKKEDIEEITCIQRKILDDCSKYLKKGGEIVYSTCSILKEENENVIYNFLKEHTDFSVEKICTVSGIEKENFEKMITKEGFLRIYPNEKTDGFFICKMQKRKGKT